jgi:hypothetical protein
MGILFHKGYKKMSKSGSAAIRVPRTTYWLEKDPTNPEEMRKPIMRWVKKSILYYS